MEALPPCETWWKRIINHDDNGEAVEITWLVRDYDEEQLEARQPAVFWELRRFLDLVYQHTAGIYSIVGRRLQEWRAIASDCCLQPFEHHFHFTPKSLHARKLPIDAGSPEFEMSSALLVAALCEAALSRALVSRGARAVLKHFLLATLTAHRCLNLIMREVPQELVATECRGREDRFKDMRQDTSRQLAEIVCSGSSPQLQVADQVLLMYTHKDKSPALQLLFEKLFIAIVGALDTDKIWAASWENDLTKNPTDLVMHGAKKRRRMDSGLQKMLGIKVVTDHMAVRTSAYIKSHPHIYSEGHGAQFNEQEVCARVAASWLNFANSIHVSLCSDGARSGNPATESFITAAYDPQKGFGTWLPPVDRMDDETLAREEKRKVSI